MPALPSAPDCDHLWREVYGDLQRFGPAHFHERRIAERLLGPLEYASLLDVGCGPGWNLPRLVRGRSLEAVAGVDVSPIAIEEARRANPGITFWVHDIQQGPVPGSWDLVHCALVLHLIPDDLAALRHLRESTGRYLYLSAMGGDFERHRAWESRLGAVRNYREGELEQKLTAAGFRLRTVVSWGFPFYSPMARTLQDLSGTGQGTYGPVTRGIAWGLRSLFYLNSSRRGDLKMIVAEV